MVSSTLQGLLPFFLLIGTVLVITAGVFYLRGIEDQRILLAEVRKKRRVMRERLTGRTGDWTRRP